MAESKNSLFKDVFFILDGDRRKEYESKKLPPRTVILPGNRPPEIIFYDFFYNLDASDSFWIETDSLNFSKQTCFQNYCARDLSTAKKWFKEKELKTLFGKGHSRLFDRWRKDNVELVVKFQEEFENVISKK